MIRYYGEQNVPGAPGQIPAPVRFDPNQLYQQPLPGYNMRPGYDPSSVDLERDRFILHSPKSGVAGGPNLPFGGGGSYKTIQQQYRPGSQDRQRIPDPIRIFPQNEPGREGAINVRFEQALRGMNGMPPMGNAGMFMGPQLGQIPAGFQNKFVS
jgi:hypothetical protein